MGRKRRTLFGRKGPDQESSESDEEQAAGEEAAAEAADAEERAAGDEAAAAEEQAAGEGAAAAEESADEERAAAEEKAAGEEAAAEESVAEENAAGEEAVAEERAAGEEAAAEEPAAAEAADEPLEEQAAEAAAAEAPGEEAGAPFSSPPLDVRSDEEAFDPVSQFFDDGAGLDDMGEEPPPTEEAPSTMMEDVNQLYSAPMGVPEPPPVPGIADRYTPPPVERRTPTGAPPEDRPDYTPTPVPQMRRDEQGGVPRNNLDDEFFVEDSDWEVSESEGGVPRGLAIGGVLGAGLVLVIVVIVGAVMIAGNRTTEPPPGTTVLEPARNIEVSGPDDPVEVRSTMAGEAEVDEFLDTDVEADPEAAGEADAEGEGEPEQAEEAAAEPAPAPAPAASPAPRPAPAPRASPPPVTRTGTLRVRANRQVLVHVDGTPWGYTPLEVPLTPGTHEISAAMKGRPETAKTEIVEVSEGSTQRIDFTF